MPPSRRQPFDLYKWKAKYGGLEVSKATRNCLARKMRPVLRSYRRRAAHVQSAPKPDLSAAANGYQAFKVTHFSQLIHGSANDVFGNLLYHHHPWLGEVPRVITLPRETLLDIAKIHKRQSKSYTVMGNLKIGEALDAPHVDIWQEIVGKMYDGVHFNLWRKATALSG